MFSDLLWWACVYIENKENMKLRLLYFLSDLCPKYKLTCPRSLNRSYSETNTLLELTCKQRTRKRRKLCSWLTVFWSGYETVDSSLRVVVGGEVCRPAGAGVNTNTTSRHAARYREYNMYGLAERHLAAALGTLPLVLAACAEPATSRVYSSSFLFKTVSFSANDIIFM